MGMIARPNLFLLLLLANLTPNPEIRFGDNNDINNAKTIPRMQDYEIT